MKRELVFFIDVDNTLLDNDHIKGDIKKSLIKILGQKEAEHFWLHHDQFREKEKLIDFPNIIREYCKEKHRETCELKLGQIFQNINFRNALYPKVPEVILHLKKLGKVAVFSEGDMVYQRRKIENSGLANLVDEVLLFEHKLDHLDEVIKKFDGYQAVFVEDRADLLDKIKKLHPKAMTLLVCQGHYASSHCPNKHISDLLRLTKSGNAVTI